MPHLPVEPIFDKVVERLGGRRGDALLSPDGANADYVFTEVNVIAELKEITKDLNRDPHSQERISTLFEKHAATPGMPSVFGRVLMRSDRLPVSARQELEDYFKRQLEGCVGKAASQIKTTRSRLALPDAAGLLILVNEGSTFATPAAVLSLLHRILGGRHHTSIDHVIYCSVNMLVAVPGHHDGARFWTDGSVRGRTRRLPDGFAARMRDMLREVIDEEIGVRGYAMSLAVDHTTDPLRVVHRPHADDPGYFIRAGRYYEDRRTRCKFYCAAISLATAQFFLLETPHFGHLVRAEYEIKLIAATSDVYIEITDASEIARLKPIADKLLAAGNC